MSGIRSTSGSAPASPVESNKGTASTSQQVAPLAAASPTGGQSNPAVPQTSAISTLTEGAALAAIVTARATAGDTILHTEAGNFRMASRNPIPVGSHVALEIESIDDVIIARVVAINGEKLASPPSVTLLPIVNNTALKPNIYGLGGQLPVVESGEGELQNITTTLGKAGQQQARVVLPHIQQQPSTATPPVQNPQAQPVLTSTTPTVNSSLLTASLSAGPQGNSGSQSISSGVAAYAHTTAPGAKAIASETGSISTSITEKADTQRQPLAPQTEIVKLIIGDALLSRRFLTSAGFNAAAPKGKISAIITPNGATLSQSAVNGQTTTTGTVISLSGPIKNSTGSRLMQVHLQTAGLGSVRYLTSAPPLPGTQVSITLSAEIERFPLAAPQPLTGIFKTPYLPIMSDWGNLRDALNVVAAQDPALGAHLLSTRIPSPNNQLGANLLFLLTALNGSNIGRWLGQNFQQTLEKAGHSDLFKSTSDDFSNLTRLTGETGGQDWKALIFPFFNGENLQQLRMFYRNHSQQTDDDADTETRFIIELDLSRTGPVQLDGLFKRHHFDLAFRHRDSIDDALKAQISNIFTENIEITGLKGSLTFRQMAPFPIHPTEEWEANVQETLKA